MGKEGGLFRYADGLDKFLMVLGSLGSIGDGLMSPLTMLALSGMIDAYSGSDFSDHVVDKYSLRLLYIAIGVGISAFMEGACWTRTAERQTSRMRTEYLKSILQQEVGFFDKQAASSSSFQVVSSISSDSYLIQDTIAEKVPNTLAHLSSFIVCIPVAFMLSWRLAFSALPFSFMFLIPGVVFGKMMKGLGMEAKHAYGNAGGMAEQAISSIRTVYSYVGELQTIDKFSSALEKSTIFGIKLGFMKGLMMGSMAIIYATWAFQSWVGSVLVSERGEKGGRVFVSGICVILGGLSIMSVLPNLSFISEASIAGTRIFKMIDRVPDIDAEDGSGKSLQHVRGSIEFRQVEFSYPSRPDTLILQGLNLKVESGKTAGLVGGSGSGKSTVISLLERFYDPIKGDILLDGNKIKRLQLKWLRSQMGLVNQEPVLFATSIKENILFGKEEAPMEHVITASKAANAHDFIIKLPDGYNTQVGQFGIQLSGGQKQRIAIARALIRDPKILLLDEATSALDAESERIVQDALDKASQGRTTLVIAHRLSTIRRANRIFVLQSGQVIESGSHEELVSKGGTYHNMIQMQQQSAPQHEASDSSPYDATMMRPRTPRTPLVSLRLSCPSSPAYTFSPIVSVSVPYSFQMENYDDEIYNNVRPIKENPSGSQWRLCKLNAPEWKQAVFGCLGAATTGLTQPIYSYCIGTVSSVYFLKDNHALKSDIRFYSIVFLGLTVVSFLSNLFQHYNFAIMGERLTKRVREKMLGKMFTFEIGWFDQDENTSAAICARLATDANMVRSLIADRMSLLVQVAVNATVAFGLALVITWRVAVVIIAMQPVIVGSFYARKVLLTSMSKKAQKAQNEGNQLASEATINHRTITAFSSQDRILGLFRGAMKNPEKESIKQSWASGLVLFSSQFLNTTSIAITLWYGGRLISEGKVTSKQLFQAFFILMTTGKYIADAGSMTSDLAKGAKAIGSVFAILDRRSEIEPDEKEGLKIRKRIKGHIELKDVFFAYPSRPNQMIFKGLDLNIEPGTTVALVGQSGSGKSTVIGLIERFYDPLKGFVLIDGNDVKSYNLRKLRSHIALVSQEPTLIAGTVHDNITYGQEDCSETELKKAAKLANAHEFISSMKDGYETYCGERGVQLSGGQKQRIAIARAILKNPEILLLDEATSALDSVSENLVQEALEKMMIGRTCVIVAHRLSTIQKATSIAIIRNGKVVEKGSHSVLLGLGRGGEYYSLIKFQKG